MVAVSGGVWGVVGELKGILYQKGAPGTPQDGERPGSVKEEEKSFLSCFHVYPLFDVWCFMRFDRLYP